MAEQWPGQPAEDEWPGVAERPVEPPRQVPGGPINLDTLTDPHEREYVQGRQGQIPPDELKENIRQFRAIQRSDQLQDSSPQPTIPATPIEEPTTTTPTVPAQPDPWWKPRIGVSDLMGPTGQAAFAAGLSTAAVTPTPFQPLGFLAGTTSAIIADEGTRRLQEQYGEVPGGIIGLVLSAVSGGGVGSAARTKPMGPFTNVSPKVVEPVPTKTPPMIISETTPRGGAYSSQEIITPPGSRISGGPYGEGQFTTGSGESLFGEMGPSIPPDTGKPLGWEPRPGQKYSLSPEYIKPRKPTGTLPEKTPTIEEKPLSFGEHAAEQAARPQPPSPKPAGIDIGSVDTKGRWVPPKDYVEPVTPSSWKQKLNAERQRWGQELPVLRTHPDSPVISSIEATHVFVEDQMESLVHQPWVKTLMKLGDNKKVAEMEARWVQAWKQGQDWMSGVPDDLKQMFKWRDEQFAIENDIRRRRGLPEIPKVEGPYLPRITDEDYKLMRAITRSQEGAKASQSVGAHAQARAVETLREGLDKGITYRDWRLAFLMREARGSVLRATDQMMTDLEKGGVLHRSPEAAKAVSVTGKAYPVDGLPFTPKEGWWVRSPEERQFLLQNLRQFDASLGNIRSWAQQWLRNPSLVNPWPHIMKNMALKQMQQAKASGLDMHKVWLNTYRYRYGTEPDFEDPTMLQSIAGKAGIPLREAHKLIKGGVSSSIGKPDMLEEFNNTMPFTSSGRTVWEVIEKAGPKTMAQQLSRGPGILNSYARRKIFAEWDPAMRYGLWREYVRKGMSPQEAANHTWIDLIRYGTRADRIDAWNSVPFNFFVPWRVGTIRTINKALQSAPVRFGLFMGAVDTLRELDYRLNGRWTHLPYDYIERPLMTLMMEGKTEALSTLAATIIAGPGGEYMFRTVQNIINTAQAKGQLGDIRTIAWGLAQVYDLWPQFQAWEKDHDPRHITDMLGLVLLGRHATPYGAPHRVGELIPESLIRTRREVKETEEFREAIKQRGEAKQSRKLQRDIQKYQQPFSPQPR